MGEHLVRQKLASDVVLVASVGTKLKNLLSDDMQYASSDSLEKVTFFFFYQVQLTRFRTKCI